MGRFIRVGSGVEVPSSNLDAETGYLISVLNSTMEETVPHTVLLHSNIHTYMDTATANRHIRGRCDMNRGTRGSTPSPQ